MISTSHRFLFIHVPKTGGNSVQNVLSEYADDDIVCIAPHHDGVERFEVRSRTYNTKKHSTLGDYYRECGAALLDGYSKFCCVRNPWDRCVSHYFSPHRGSVEWDRDAFIDFVGREVAPLESWLAVHPGESLKDSLRRIDAVMRFEQLPHDFKEVTRTLGLPEKALPHRNSSKGKAPFRDYYDDGAAQLVGERFRQEIEVFGYRLD